MDPADLLDRLWAQGAGLDDRQAIRIARDSATGTAADELTLWADWVGTEEGLSTGVDDAIAERLAGDPAARLIMLAVELRAAVLRREHAVIDEALVAIDRSLGRTPRDERGAVAHAAADLACAEAALYGRDLPAARRFLDPLVGAGPTAIRVTALMRMATLSLANTDPRGAQKHARQALTLARSASRPAQAHQAQLLLGLVAAMAGDAATMRGTLEPLLAANPSDAFARFLLAGLEDTARATELLADGLAAAAARGDALGYALCALVGARRYLDANRRGDALVVMSAARLQLAPSAPQLVAVLEGELAAWRAAWGDAAFAEAEREAIAALDRDAARGA